MLKVLHVPSMDALFEDQLRLDEPSAVDEALLFAIYYAAVVSLEEEDVRDPEAVRTEADANRCKQC